jgi:hypothetical protein
MGDQIEMLHATGRIDEDEVVFARAPNFPELRYELPQVSALPMKSSLSARPIFLRRDMNRLRGAPCTSSVTG